MTILLVILGLICLLVGLLGCVIPVLPGPPLSYVGILLIHFTDKYEFSTPLLLILLVLTVLVTVLDYLIPMWGSKYFGASKWGTRGSFIGTIIGAGFASGQEIRKYFVDFGYVNVLCICTYCFNYRDFCYY